MPTGTSCSATSGAQVQPTQRTSSLSGSRGSPGWVPVSEQHRAVTLPRTRRLRRCAPPQPRRATGVESAGDDADEADRRGDQVEVRRELLGVGIEGLLGTVDAGHLRHAPDRPGSAPAEMHSADRRRTDTTSTAAVTTTTAAEARSLPQQGS